MREGRSAGGRLSGNVGLVLRMGVGMAVFVFLGYGLDRAFRTSPWFLLAGTVTGAAAIILDLAHMAGVYGRRAGKSGGRGED